jgi:hypothetical protein
MVEGARDETSRWVGGDGEEVVERERETALMGKVAKADGDDDARAPTRCLWPVRNLSTPQTA